MPRKPGIGPPILRIESMSTGRVYRPLVVDEFTGQRIDMPADTQPVRPLRDAQDILDERKRKRVALQRILLERIGILPSPVRVGHHTGHRKHGPILTVNGQKYELRLPPKPLRRI